MMYSVPSDSAATEAGSLVEPSVSVALGTHNGAAFIEAQLRSILGQSRPVDEIVISDDASSDDTVALVEELVRRHRTSQPTPSLLVVRNASPLGITANFEQAMRTTTGQLVALADQDDVWHVDRVARSLAAFAADPRVALVASDARLVDETGVAIGDETLFDTLRVGKSMRLALQSDTALDALLQRNVLTGATMMVSRELIEHAAPFPASWVHDEWLAVVASVRGRIAIVDGPLIDYRQHDGNQIGVRRLGAGGKLARLREPRSARNSRLLARASDLAARLPAIVEHDERVMDAVAAKLAHERVRSALPVSRFSRLRPIWREWRSGAYDRYGLGLQDVLRDSVQPD
jgi:glycosyltransferase involved in cell wall biosynthesis